MNQKLPMTSGLVGLDLVVAENARRLRLCQGLKALCEAGIFCGGRFLFPPLFSS